MSPLKGIFKILFFAFSLVMAGTSVCLADNNPAGASVQRAQSLFRTGHYSLSKEFFAAISESQINDGQMWTRAHAMVLFNEGAAGAAMGDIGGAVLSFRQSLAVFEKLGEQDGLDIALALEGLASVLLQQENVIEAEECLGRALAVRQTFYDENHPQLARIYALQATAAYLNGDLESTEELNYKALMAYRKIHGNVHPTVAAIIQNIGILYTEMGLFQAEIMFRQAADVGEMLYGPQHPVRAVSLTNYGRLRWREGRFQDAEEFLNEALAIYENLGVKSNPELAVCLFQLGRTLMAQDRFDEAVAVLDRAADVYESVWWRAGSGAERSLAVLSPYPMLALAHLRLGHQELALEAFNTHQGRLAALSGRLRDLPLVLAAKRDSLVLDLTKREDLLAGLEADLASDKQKNSNFLRTKRALARSAMAEAEAQWLVFQTEVSNEIFSETFLTSQDVRRNLDSHEAAVGWLSAECRPGEFSSWAFIIHLENGLVWVELPKGEEGGSPSDLTAGALAAITENDDILASALSDIRHFAVASLEPHLVDVDRLVVIASGFLAGFPVELLLPDSMEVVYTAFLPVKARSSWVSAGEMRRAKVLVVADPSFSKNHTLAMNQEDVTRAMPGPTVLRSVLGGNREAIDALPSLAGTRREASVLGQLFPETTSLLGASASEAVLRNMATEEILVGYNIIHLATHALIDAERPGRSALVLSQLGEDESDGLLTVREITRTWQLDAELVTLSACATGLGRRIDGEGFLGFTQSLMGVGAKNVLVSLWPVDDRATAMLMERFYGNLAGGVSPGEALREARGWLKEYRTPVGSRPFEAERFWAGFVIFGR